MAQQLQVSLPPDSQNKQKDIQVEEKPRVKPGDQRKVKPENKD